MSTALLDRLKIKPIPQIREQVAITIPVPTKKAEVVVKTELGHSLFPFWPDQSFKFTFTSKIQTPVSRSGLKSRCK